MTLIIFWSIVFSYSRTSVRRYKKILKLGTKKSIKV